MTDIMPEQPVARVLVVDDEPELRELLVDALSADDTYVAAAASGTEAIDLARAARPDIVVADVNLGDFSGMEVIDRIRAAAREDIPAVVITGFGDAGTLTQASRCRPVELMTKPLDVERLRRAVRKEMTRRADTKRQQRRGLRLRRLARGVNIERKNIHRQLDTTCADLTSAYRTLSGQMALQQVVLGYQRELLGAKTDDDVFRYVFRLFVGKSGPVHGVAMVCDAGAELQMVGRFGVPYPDPPDFCDAVVRPMVAAVLSDPHCTLLDAGQEENLFDESIRKYLPGLSILAVPLMPSPGELIGMVVLYRKGEQPFTDGDVSLGEMIAVPTALAVRRND